MHFLAPWQLWVTTSDSNVNSDGSSGLMDIQLEWRSSRTGHGWVTRVDVSRSDWLLNSHWDRVEEWFLQSAHQGPLRLGVDKNNSTLHAILKGDIFTKLNEAGRLLISWDIECPETDYITKDMINAVPVEHTIDGFTITLSPLDRLYIVQRCRDAGQRDVLRSV